MVDGETMVVKECTDCRTPEHRKDRAELSAIFDNRGTFDSNNR